MARHKHRSKTRKNQRHPHINPTTQPTPNASLDPDVLYDQRQYADAIPGFEAQLTKTPSDRLRRMLGRCYIAENRYGDGLAMLQTIENPDERDWTLIGYAYAGLGEWQAADEAYETAWQIQPNPVTAELRAEALQREQNFYALDDDTRMTILSYWEQGMAVPGPNTRIALLWALYARVDRKTLVQQLEAVWPISANPLPIRAHLVKAYGAMGDPERAQSHINILIDEAPTPWHWWLAYRVAVQQGEDGIAAEHLQACQNASEGNDQVRVDWYWVWGDLYRKQGNIPMALDQYERMTQDGANIERQIIGWIQLAALDFQRKQRAQGIVALGQAVERWRANKKDPVELADVGCFKFEGHWEWYGELPWPNIVKRLGSPRANEPREVFGAALHMAWQSAANTEIRNDKLLRKAVNWASPDDAKDILYDLMHAALDNDQWVLALDAGIRYHLRGTEISAHDEKNEELSQFFALLPVDTPEGQLAYHDVLWNQFQKTPPQPPLVPVWRECYQSFWRQILLNLKRWDEWIEITHALREVLSADGNKSEAITSLGLLWDEAFGHGERGDFDEAQVLYEQYIALEPNDRSAWHNLAIIWNQKGNEEKAFQHIAHAHDLDPENTLTAKVYANMQKSWEEHRQREAWLQEAPNRWRALDYRKRQLLLALSTITDSFKWRDLANLSGIDEHAIQGHWRKLVEGGFILEPEQGWEINPHLVPILQKELSHTTVVKAIHANPNYRFKPIFNSQREYSVYRVLTTLFPNHLVFPNMGLQAIFQYDRLKPQLPAEEFGYYLRAQVDCCVTSTSTYLPIVAFEIDSEYHDDPAQQARDRRKDHIFQVGGVPLLRVRVYGQPSLDAIREKILQSLRALGQRLRKTQEGGGDGIHPVWELDFDQWEQIALPPQTY